MTASEQLKELVERMPDPGPHGMLTQGIDKEKIETTIAEIHGGGRDNVHGLIDMLGKPGSEANVKPHYALHCLVNHTLVVKDEAGRRQLCEILAGELDAERPVHIKTFLCQELGWAGRRESVAALGRALVDEELSSPAAMALTAIRDGAAAEFRAAWPKATGEARRHIIDGLAAVADPPSAAIFKQALRDGDQEVRLAAAAGLASLGDLSAVDDLLKTTAAAGGWERFQAAKSCLLLAEKLAASGKKAEAKGLYEKLKRQSDGKSWEHLRHAAELGLAAIDDRESPVPSGG